MSSKSSRKHILPTIKARLPVELMLLVVRSVTDTPTLRNLSLTSRAIHTFAQPLLFEHVSFTQSREHSLKLIDILCSESDSRLFKFVKEVKVSVNAMIPQSSHDEVKESKETGKLYNRDPVPVHIRSSKYSYSYTPENTAAEWASQLEFSLYRFWMSCCRNIRTLSFEVAAEGYGSQDSRYLDETFCINVALFPLMRCNMPKLKTLRLKGGRPSTIGNLLRALMLPELPDYVDDLECAEKIKGNIEQTAFWRDRLHGSNGPRGGTIVGANQKRIRILEVITTEAHVFEWTMGAALQASLSPGPPYDATALLVSHIKPAKLTLDIQDHIGVEDLLSGVAIKLDPDDELPEEGFKIPKALQPAWYINGLEEIQLRNCKITNYHKRTGLSTILGDMRQLRRLHLDSILLDDEGDTWGAVFRSCANKSSLRDIRLSHLYCDDNYSRFCGGPVGLSDRECPDMECEIIKDEDKPLLLTKRSPSAKPRENKFLVCSGRDEDKDGLLELYKSQRKKHASFSDGEQWDRRNWVVCWHGTSVYK